MAKFLNFDIKLNENYEPIGLEDLKNNQLDLIKQANVVYLYRNAVGDRIYIGQTKHFLTRHKEHYQKKEKAKFIESNFNQVKILGSRYFNGSALDDVEKQLITYFMADKTKSTEVLYDTDDVINGNTGNSVNEYENMERVSSEVVLPFWENVLYPEGWVTNPTLDQLRKSALVKYSPIKQLTKEQEGLIAEIIQNDNKNYVINGDAGTGKTVLLTHLVARLLNETKKNIAVVVQPNWEKTAKDIFKVFGISNFNLTIATSTKLLTQNKDFDVIIVDESHKLSRRGQKQHPSFEYIYKISKFENCQNHLEALKLIGKQVILMYDVLQAIRPANISRANFQDLTMNFEKRYLTTQFRIQTPKGASYTSDDYINGIKYLLYKDTNLLEYTNFDPNFDRSLFQNNAEIEDEDKETKYFGYFENSPLNNLKDWLEEDKNYYPSHVNRLLSGLVEDWRQNDGKDPSITHFHENGLSLRWNSTQENWINSSDEDAEDQIGSVFAVQGIDLNNVGVLIGNDLLVDEDGKLYGEPANFKNVNGKHKKEDLELPENRREFTMFVLNIYYVLLTRGIDGVRIGFWHNEDFKEYFKKIFDIID